MLADNESGAREATKALLADGFTRIAFVGGDLALTTACERLSGFALAMAEAGQVTTDARLGGMGIADGYRLMDRIMQEKKPPQALFAVNLLVHLGMDCPPLLPPIAGNPEIDQLWSTGHVQSGGWVKFRISWKDVRPRWLGYRRQPP